MMGNKIPRRSVALQRTPQRFYLFTSVARSKEDVTRSKECVTRSKEGVTRSKEGVTRGKEGVTRGKEGATRGVEGVANDTTLWLPFTVPFYFFHRD